ncbi:MAG: hypothetical protein IJZ61_03800 [Oscillospiraceae bacterium]|nr:hypothetical protein [Oscillospiraceae bacterium]
MKYRYILALALSAALLCGCEKEKAETEVTETTAETTETTFNEYILTRSWDGAELLASVFFCGEYQPMPWNIEACPDFQLSDNILIFPDGSFAEVSADENGNILSVKFSAETAPADFSIYGIDFNAEPKDIPEKVGYANSISGSENSEMVFEFNGGGISQLIFEFNEKSLIAVYINL